MTDPNAVLDLIGSPALLEFKSPEGETFTVSLVDGKDGGLDHVIEQGGKNLSGGQRQRLTIARALVRRPKILILDDSSSALDYATDAKLRQSISQLDFNPTTFIVSQRTASIMSCDKIIVLDDGAVVGTGTHEELLALKGRYYELYMGIKELA